MLPIADCPGAFETCSTSTHSTFLSSLTRACFKTSSIFLTQTISISFLITSGISIKSFLFSNGIKTFFILALWREINLVRKILIYVSHK